MSLIEVKNTDSVEQFFFSLACLDDVRLGCYKIIFYKKKLILASANCYQKSNENLKE